MQLSVKDVSKLLNLSEDEIYSMIKKKKIPSYDINDQIRFNKAELLEWATANRITVCEDIFKDNATGETPLPGFIDALKCGDIVYNIKGDDQASVLRSVVDIIKLPKEVNRDFFYQVLLARETLGSTGIGDGIAIPHVRNPVVLKVKQPSATICFLEKPIDFNAIDKKPVNILFVLISPAVRSHLFILSRLGLLLQNTELKDALKRQAAKEELMEIITRIDS